MKLNAVKNAGTKVYVGITTLYGVWKGLERWWDWKSERKPITVNNNTVDPVLNSAYMGYYTMVAGMTSGMIAATFPVSIPLMIMFAKEIKTEKTENNA